MYYVNVAYCLMKIAHRGQKDKQGVDYEEHTRRVGLAMQPWAAAEAVGYLHDTVEDTAVTLNDLRGMGFPAYVVTAVEALTRREDEDYAKFIERCALDPIAKEVKIADITDNLRLPIPDGCEHLHKRYRKALAFLRGE